MSENDSPEELRLLLDHANGEIDRWQVRCTKAHEELYRTKLLLEVAETKFANLEKILQAYPVAGRKARELALEMAVQLSGPMDEGDIFKTAEHFEKWLGGENG